MTLTLTWDRRTWNIYETCGPPIQYAYTRNNFAVLSPLVGVNFQPLGCPAFITQLTPVFLTNETFCDSGKKIPYQQAGYDKKIDVCGVYTCWKKL
jgi:hypothetical protein